MDAILVRTLLVCRITVLHFQYLSLIEHLMVEAQDFLILCELSLILRCHLSRKEIRKGATKRFAKRVISKIVVSYPKLSKRRGGGEVDDKCRFSEKSCSNGWSGVQILRATRLPCKSLGHRFLQLRSQHHTCSSLQGDLSQLVFRYFKLCADHPNAMPV